MNKLQAIRYSAGFVLAADIAYNVAKGYMDTKAGTPTLPGVELIMEATGNAGATMLMTTPNLNDMLKNKEDGSIRTGITVLLGIAAIFTPPAAYSLGQWLAGSDTYIITQIIR